MNFLFRAVCNDLFAASRRNTELRLAEQALCELRSEVRRLRVRVCDLEECCALRGQIINSVVYEIEELELNLGNLERKLAPGIAQDSNPIEDEFVAI